TQTPLLPDVFLRWFEQRGWTPRVHQLALLEHARADRSTLLIAPTGAGKTLAGFLPTLVELAEQRIRPGRIVSTGRDLTRAGGLLSLSLARRFRVGPRLCTVGLSATVADPAELCRYLVPQPAEGTAEADLVVAEGGAAPHVTMLDSAEQVPWAGHSARHALAE